MYEHLHVCTLGQCEQLFQKTGIFELFNMHQID